MWRLPQQKCGESFATVVWPIFEFTSFPRCPVAMLSTGQTRTKIPPRLPRYRRGTISESDGFLLMYILNELRSNDFMEVFGRYFSVLEVIYDTEGYAHLTPEIRHELANWSEEDLTRRNLTVLLSA